MLPEAVDIQGPTVGCWALRVSRIFTLGTLSGPRREFKVGCYFTGLLFLAVDQLNSY
jgi:hypothetical protein